MKFHRIIGIAGRTGSGRTTIAKAIAQQHDVPIVSDLTDSQAAWVRKNGGLVIHVTRPGHDAISDSGVKVVTGDVELFNCDTIEQFRYAVAQLFEGVKS